MTTRYFVVAPFIAARTDLLLTAPAMLMASLGDVLPLRAFRPPMPLPLVGGHLVWHERSQGDEAHRWFRSFFVEQARAIATDLLSRRGLPAGRSG